MAGISPQGEGQFFNLQMLDHATKGLESHQEGANIPYIRNLLYWEPDFRFSDEGSPQLRFSTPDTPGTYVLSLRGSNRENEYILSYHVNFLVK